MSLFARLSKLSFKCNFTTMSGTRQNRLYDEYRGRTWLTLFSANITTGLTILYERRNKQETKDYPLQKVSIIVFTSFIKATVYSLIWPIFWSYAIIRPMVLPIVPCKVDLDEGYSRSYNYNGLMPHFIPNYKDTLCVTGEELQTLYANNMFGPHLIKRLGHLLISLQDRFLYTR